MTDVDKLLRRYVERFESGGEVDPSDLLGEVEGSDRAQLSELIEGYLEFAAPTQEWNAETFEGSIAERAVARLAESWSTASGELPHELVALRNERQIKRRDLVARLAEFLGLSSEEEKVGLRYHELEHGLLPSEGVSSKVFDALAKILGTTADTLRRAGESVAPSAGGEQGPLFARKAQPAPPADEMTFQHSAPGHLDKTEDKTTEQDWDEVDRLFLGGG